MKKPVIAIAVLVLVAAGIVLPANYFGQVAETTLRERLANMPYGYQMQVVGYERGWFSSTATLEWQPFGGMFQGMGAFPPGGLPVGAMGELEEVASLPDLSLFRIDIEVAHGPVFFAVAPGVGLFTARGSVGMNVLAEAAGADPSWEEDVTLLEFEASSFSGATVHNRLFIPGLEESFGPLSLNLGEVRLDGEWSGPGSFQLQRASLADLSASVGEPEAFLVRMTGFDARTEYPDGIEDGALLAPAVTTSSLGELLAGRSDDDVLFRMSGLTAEDTFSLDENGLYGGESVAALESLEVAGRAFSAVAINQRIGGLSEQALLDYLAAAVQAPFPLPPEPQDPGAGTDESVPVEPVPGADESIRVEPVPQAPSMGPQLPPELAAAVLAMFKNGIYYGLDAVLTYEREHKVTFGFEMGYDAEKAPLFDALGLVPALLAGLELSMEFSVPVVAAGEILGQSTVQMARMQGLLQEQDGVLQASIGMKQGMLTLNGMPVPLGALPGVAPGTPPGVPPG